MLEVAAFNYSFILPVMCWDRELYEFAKPDGHLQQ